MPYRAKAIATCTTLLLPSSLLCFFFVVASTTTSFLGFVRVAAFQLPNTRSLVSSRSSSRAGLFQKAAKAKTSLLAACAASRSNSNATTTTNNMLSLTDFLQWRKRAPTNHWVIGNQAGDADSILSAITLAHVDALLIGNSDNDSTTTSISMTQKTPIVSIPRADLTSQRPETMLLLEWAGLTPESCRDLLYFVDDVPSLMNSAGSEDALIQLTLVDHNRLTETSILDCNNNNTKIQVVEILDHHFDEGAHLETCPADVDSQQQQEQPNKRMIAFAKEQATVASTCTLVAERLLASWPPSSFSNPKEQEASPQIPLSLGVLLLGTILLDSVNMLPQAGKGTPRDAQAITSLLEHVAWHHLDEPAKATLKVAAGGSPDTTVFFEALQAAKFDPVFWKSLSVRDALRLDYKRFSFNDDNGDDKAFGVSTVLLPLDDFMAKQDLATSLNQYRQEAQVDVLGVMLTHVNQHDVHCRQLVLCGAEPVISDLVGFMVHDQDAAQKQYDADSLRLTETKACESFVENVVIRCFDQGNAKASRKQVAPIMLHFFQCSTSNSNL